MTKWRRVNKRTPCPICKKADWCTVLADGTGVLCMRVESRHPRPGGGWFHWLKDPVPPPPERPERDAAPPVEDWDALQQECWAAASTEAIALFAGSLAVSAASLVRLGVGRHPKGSWTFPFRNAGGRVIGIQMRGSAGRKWCVEGSKLGLFIARDGPRDRWLMICEGASDTAALMDYGFDAVGRPSCSACVDMIAEYAIDRDCVIVEDSDGPGIAGAEALVRPLQQTAASVRVIRPHRRNDVRGWGASRQAWQCMIGNANPR